MRNKKLLAVAGLVVCLAAGSIMTASAADNTLSTEQEDNKITFKVNDDDGSKDPGDPDDGDNLLPDPDDENIDPLPNEGPFSLVAVPKFQFGTENIPSDTSTQYYTYKAAGTVSGPNSDLKRAYFVEVKNRRGTEAGWKVKAELKKQFSTASDSHTLTGSKIDLTNTRFSGSTGTTAPWFKDRTLELGAPVVIASAEGTQGMGSTYISFGTEAQMADSVILSIPTSLASSIRAEEYTATIKWDLESGPASDAEKQ